MPDGIFFHDIKRRSFKQFNEISAHYHLNKINRLRVRKLKCHQTMDSKVFSLLVSYSDDFHIGDGVQNLKWNNDSSAIDDLGSKGLRGGWRTIVDRRVGNECIARISTIHLRTASSDGGSMT